MNRQTTKIATQEHTTHRKTHAMTTGYDQYKSVMWKQAGNGNAMTAKSMNTFFCCTKSSRQWQPKSKYEISTVQ